MVELLSVSFSSSKEPLMDGLYDNKCRDVSYYDYKCQVLEAAFGYNIDLPPAHLENNKESNC